MKLHFITYNNNQILHPPTKLKIADPLIPVNHTINRSERYNMIQSIQNNGKCLACNKIK